MKAYAKVNLFLEIPGKHEDGYHEIDTCMQSVSLFDELTVSSAADGIELSCSDPQIPSGRGNIAYKAAELFFRESGIEGGCKIYIDKHIPSQAGLGGGSADGAGVLKALNILYGRPFSDDRLSCLSVNVGADLPFCVLGGLRICRGIGEKVGENNESPCRYFVIAKDRFGISTAEAYRAIDRIPVSGEITGSDEFLKRYLSSSFRPSDCLFNRFETVLESLCPDCLHFIESIRNYSGNCILSGSGSAVFSVSGSFEEAEKTSVFIKYNYPDAFVGIYTGKDKGCEIIDGGISNE